MKLIKWGSILCIVMFLHGCKRVEEFRAPPSSEKIKSEDLIHMRVKDLVSDREGNPVVILEEINGKRNLYIWIGYAEARAIHAELSHQKIPRPMTHDLIRDIFLALGVKVIKVVVTDLKNNIFYARLYLEDRGDIYSIDSRPSDAIAISLRTGAPIYVTKRVLEKSGVPPEQMERNVLYIASLGIYLQEMIGEELREIFGVSQGVIVTQVERGAGERMGIRRGDVIIEVNNKAVKNINDILEIVEEGELKEIKVIREGEIVVLKK